MRTLNRAAAEVLVAAGIGGATDVTGFGLLGHGLEMARASGTRLAFDAATLPALPGALVLAAAGSETGGAGHNRRFVAPALDVGPASGTPWWRWPTIHRRAGACWPPSRPNASRRWRQRSRPPAFRRGGSAASRPPRRPG